MTTKRKFEILGAALTLLLTGCFLRAWVLERESRIRAEVTVSAEEQTVASKDADIKARDEATSKLTTALTSRAQNLTTPQQAAKVIVSYLPAPIATPIPIVDRTDLPAAIRADLPPDPSPLASVGVVTDKQLLQIGKDELAGDVCRKNLQTCQADKIDLTTVVTAKSSEVAVLQVAVKGGTKLQRVGRVLKFAGCAGAGAGLARLAKASPTGTAIGAASGVVGCSLF